MLFGKFAAPQELRDVFQDPWTFDRYFPGVARDTRFPASDLDAQWMRALPSHLNKLKDVAINVLDIGYDKFLCKGWVAVRAYDMASIWSHSEELKEQLAQLRHAYQQASDVKTPLVGGIALLSAGDDADQPDAKKLRLGDASCDSELSDAAKLKRQIAEFAPKERAQQVATVVIPLNETADVVASTVGKHSLFKVFGGDWKTLRRLLVVNVTHMPEGHAPYKKPASKKACFKFAESRIKSMLLLAVPCDVVAVFLGFNQKTNSAIDKLIDGLVEADPALTKLPWYLKELYLNYIESLISKVLVGEGPYSSIDVTRVRLLSRSDFAVLRKKVRCDGKSTCSNKYDDVPFVEPKLQPQLSIQDKRLIWQGAPVPVDDATVAKTTRTYNRLSTKVRDALPMNFLAMDGAWGSTFIVDGQFGAIIDFSPSWGPWGLSCFMKDGDETVTYLAIVNNDVHKACLLSSLESAYIKLMGTAGASQSTKSGISVEDVKSAFPALFNISDAAESDGEAMSLGEDDDEPE